MQPEDFRPEDLFGQIESLAEALDAEREARERAEAADRAKSDLLAVVSHELRTPMGALISMAELLLVSQLEPRRGDMPRRWSGPREVCSRCSTRSSISPSSKPAASRLRPRLSICTNWSRAPAMRCAARADEKALQGGVHIGTSCPRYIKGDASRIRQILANLIDNAVKFTSRGSVKLHVNAGETYGKLTLRFDVIDTGSGLSESRRAAVPALRSGRAHGASLGGTGLGLSIARRLVELMGGEIGCESAPARGACSGSRSPPSGAAPRDACASQWQARGPRARGRGQCRQPHADRGLSRRVRPDL